MDKWKITFDIGEGESTIVAESLWELVSELTGVADCNGTLISIEKQAAKPANWLQHSAQAIVDWWHGGGDL